MLRIYSKLANLRFGELMEVYEESNRDNCGEFYPELSPEQQRLQGEQDFYAYLRDDFFTIADSVYAVWEIDGRYVSALRLEPYRDGCLLTALETKPDRRGCGYAKNLITHVLDRFPGRIYSHVGKKNPASLHVHQECGFKKISDTAVYLDGSVDSRCCTLCFEK